MSTGIVWMYNPDGHKIRFPWHSVFTRSHEEISGVWAADRFWTNEREYPLRLDTSQSSLKWWLAARQEVLSSSKYFLNTTKYYASPNTPFSPGSWGRHTVQRGRRGQPLPHVAWSPPITPGTDITPVSHAAGPRLASAGPAHMSLTRQLSSGPRAEQCTVWPGTDIWHPSPWHR